MTIQNDDRKTTPVVTDGTTGIYYYDFPIFFGEDGQKGLEVRYENELNYDVVSPTEYIVLPNTENTGGYVQFQQIPVAGKNLIIVGKTQVDQQLNITNHGKFQAEAIETNFDKIVAIMQEWSFRLSEEERQRIANDSAIVQQYITAHNELKAYLEYRFDMRWQEMSDYLDSLLPMFFCIMRKELNAFVYSDEGIQKIIDQIGDAADFVTSVVGKTGHILVSDISNALGLGDVAYKDTIDLMKAENLNTLSDEAQQQINDRGGATWYAKSGGYNLNDHVILGNGDEVKSTEPNNTNNPNVNMTGWFNESKQQRELAAKTYRDNQTIYDYGAVGDGELHTVEEWYTPVHQNYRGYANLAAVQADYPFVTDKDFSCDQAAILKLADIKSINGGGSVDLSKGHYYLKPISNGAFLPIPTKVLAVGHFEDTILHGYSDISDDPNTSVGWDLVLFTGSDNTNGGIINCTIRHTGGRRNNAASIAVRGGANGKKIRGNIIENTIGSGVVIEFNVNASKPTICDVYENKINSTSRHCVYIVGASGNRVFNNDCNLNALEAIAIRGDANNDIHDNRFFGVAGNKAHAITLAAPPSGAGGYKYKGLRVSGNKAFGIRGAFFYGQGVGCQLSESEISGNYINQSVEADVTDHDLMLYRTSNTKIKDNIFDGGRNRGVMLYGCQGNEITGNTLKNLNEAGNSVGLVFCADYADSYDSTTTYSTGNNIKSNKFIDDRGVQKHAHVIQMLTGSNKNNVSKNTYVGGANTKIQSADGLAAQNIGEKTDGFLFTKAAMALGTVAASNMLIGGNSASVYSSSDAYVKEFRLTIAQVLTSGTVTARLYKNGVAIIANVFNANGVLRTNPLLFQPQQYTVDNGDLFTVTIESSGTTSGQAQVDATVSVIFAE